MNQRLFVPGGGLLKRTERVKRKNMHGAWGYFFGHIWHEQGLKSESRYSDFITQQVNTKLI
jgi:hypothetical protein